MKKEDLIPNKSTEIGVAVVKEIGDTGEEEWNVYLLNFRNELITTVLVSSKGYLKNEMGDTIKTSMLRHYFEAIDGNDYRKIEPIDPAVFKLNNEYWVSFYSGKDLLDRKFIFIPESIKEENFSYIKMIDKKGVLIK